VAGTIIADVIQSDQSYPSSINIASPVIISNTFAFPAGTVSAPAFFPTGDTNTGIFFPAADTIAFTEGGVEAMRITSAGNVGIGTSSPVQLLTVESTGNVRQVIRNSTENTSYASSLDFVTGSGSLSSTNVVARVIGLITQADPSALQSALTFHTNAGDAVAERMRIDTSGNLLVGTTSNPIAGGASCVVASGYGTRSGFNGSYTGFRFLIDWTGSPQLWIDATNVGTISTTSDYRTKKNVEAQTKPAIDRVLQLRPVKYEMTDYGTLFKADGVMREGFIAHELQEVIPSAVEGEKDSEDQIQSLRLDALCSVMVKAIQEQQAIIESLKTRIETLEAQA
jgi:hypothetical protein